MDAGTFNPIQSFLTGEVVVASATASACAAWFASLIRRQTVRRRYPSTLEPAVSHPSLLVRPLLSGEYRGRVVQMTQEEDWLNVTVRVANRVGVFAEFGTGGNLAFWLTNASQRRLNALAGKWTVVVREQTILLSCHAVNDPERLRTALEIACDLADTIDLISCTLHP